MTQQVWGQVLHLHAIEGGTSRRLSGMLNTLMDQSTND